MVAVSSAEVLAVDREAAKVATAKVATALAAPAVAQAERAAGLRIANLPEPLHKEFGGVFTVNECQPVTSGCPHWSTPEGGHLFYSPGSNCWVLSTRSCEPGSCVRVATAGAVPTGEVRWAIYVPAARQWGDRRLVVTELAELPRWRRAGRAPHRRLIGVHKTVAVPGKSKVARNGELPSEAWSWRFPIARGQPDELLQEAVPRRAKIRHAARSARIEAKVERLSRSVPLPRQMRRRDP